jgi:asparagine synthase (glutamine-hydrolysing)
MPMAGETAQRMLDSIIHRGPDHGALESLQERQLWLGHRRLSIIELSPLGHQPMYSPDRSACLVYNGEIYNFAEIRTDLEGLGHSFRGHSDTEVILAAWRQWGEAAIKRFRGMFAFALWDSRTRQLHLCRDRFGVKPLYYTVRKGQLAFASELRALHSAGFCTGALDAVALADYVRQGYFCSPHSIWEGIRAVPPGSVMTFGAGLAGVVSRYWSLRDEFEGSGATALRAELAGMSEAALLSHAQAVLRESFAYRMVADVPVGVFLSGGIDSSLVCAELAQDAGARLKTYTIGYGDSGFDESVYAKEVADTIGSDHTSFVVASGEMLGLVERLVELSDEPIGDSSLIPNLMVSELARRHVKVALAADGADELFGGYVRYQACGRWVATGPLARSLRWLSAESLAALPPALLRSAYQVARGGRRGYADIEDKLRKYLRMSRSRDECGAYLAAMSEWEDDDLRTFGVHSELAESEARSTWRDPGSAVLLDRMMYFDLMRYLPGDLLTKGDRASMSVSLEVREPFLDQHIVRLAAALPPNWKIRDGKGKYLLRGLLDRHFRQGLFDRPKQGFSAPIREWMLGPLREAVRFELSRERVRSAGLLDDKAVPRVAERFLSGGGGASAAGIWSLFQLQRWAHRWGTEHAT